MKQSADMLAFDMPFAKVVSTPEGDSLLIGGAVYRVTGPEGNAADLFSMALRRAGRGDATGLVGVASQAAGGQINAAYQAKMAS